MSMSTAVKALGITLGWIGVAVVLSALAPSPAVSEEQGVGCDEQTMHTNETVHAFVGGACYLGYPNARHTNWQSGYCGNWHQPCPS